MSIAEKLRSILNSKQNIKSAIQNKGIDLTNIPLSGYADAIDQISYAGVDISVGYIDKNGKFQQLKYQNNQPVLDGQSIDGLSAAIFETGIEEPNYENVNSNNLCVYKCASVGIIQESPSNATSNNGDYYIISSSSSYSENWDPWKAFNGGQVQTNYGWFSHTGDSTPWIKIQFTTPKIITKYKFNQSWDGQNQILSNWIFQGSNDNETWIDLDIQTSKSLAEGAEFITEIPNKNEYIYYRFYFPNTSGYSYIGIQNIKLYSGHANQWKGYKAFFSNGKYNYQKELTHDILTYSAIVPMIGYSYSSNALAKISLYDGIIPTENLILYLPLIENYNSEIGANFNLQGSLSFQKYNGFNCAYFNGNSYLILTNMENIPYNGEERTISFWFNTSNNSTNNNILGHGTTNYGGGQWFTLRPHTSSIEFTGYGSGNDYGFDYIPQVNNWNHLCITIKNNIIKHYINGSLVYIKNLQSYCPTVNNVLCIGCTSYEPDRNSQKNYVGYLTAFRMYNRILTDTEILNLTTEFIL